MRPAQLRSFATLTLLALGGCSAPPAGYTSSEPSGSSESPILNGNPLSNLTAYNAVELPGCSAIAIDERWVLTARHCTCGGSLAYPCTSSIVPNVSIATRAAPIENRFVRELYQHPNVDIALLRVDPFKEFTYHNELWGWPMAPLDGQYLYCIGDGQYRLPNIGDGQWRGAALRVGATSATGYTFFPLHEDLPQIPWMGDSGGPCFFSSALKAYTPATAGTQVIISKTYVAGVQSTVTWDCPWFLNSCAADRATAVTSATQVGLTASVVRWIRDIQKRARFLFVDSIHKRLALSFLERTGEHKSLVLDQVASVEGWTHIVLLRDDAIFFYDANGGTAATATLDEDGNFTGAEPIADFAAPGFTHVVAASADGILLANANDGTAVTARVDARGAYTAAERIDALPTGFTHLAATRDGGVFFYDAARGTGATGVLDEDLRFSPADTVLTLPAGLTHVTAVDHDGLFFYDAASGLAFPARLGANGEYRESPRIDAVAPGYTSVTGATSGGLLLIDDTNRVATIARLEDGVYAEGERFDDALSGAILSAD